MAKHLEYTSAAKALRTHADPVRSATYRGFFKDSGADHFLGIPTPVLRRLAKDFSAMPLQEVRKLMQSGIHEERSLANEILRLKFRGGDDRQQKQIFDFYLRNKKLIREWDGVDGTAPYIAGPYLLDRDKQVLYELARSSRIWDRRIAIVSTWWFIRNGQIDDTFKLAEILLQDREDLIHKAVGWMLRETGKQNAAELRKFLKLHSKAMPRTMLRYAIERFTPEERKKWMAK
jgi:3-methyladenine DNA glycosylase AlkD